MNYDLKLNIHSFNIKKILLIGNYWIRGLPFKIVKTTCILLVIKDMSVITSISLIDTNTGNVICIYARF